MQNGTSRTRARVCASSVLPEPGRADQQHVRLLELDLVDLVAGVDPLVVVVDGDREDLLGPLLADHVLVERVLDLVRVRELRARALRARRLEQLFLDDLLAQVDALVADVDALTCDQLADLFLALPAERASIRDLGSLRAGARRRHVPVPGQSLLFFGSGAASASAASSAAFEPSPPAIPASCACAIRELLSTA